jgi:hypothetical protein
LFVIKLHKNSEKSPCRRSSSVCTAEQPEEPVSSLPWGQTAMASPVSIYSHASFVCRQLPRGEPASSSYKPTHVCDVRKLWGCVRWTERRAPFHASGTLEQCLVPTHATSSPHPNESSRHVVDTWPAITRQLMSRRVANRRCLWCVQTGVRMRGCNVGGRK